jgi:hypothetical protein
MPWIKATKFNYNYTRGSTITCPKCGALTLIKTLPRLCSGCGIIWRGSHSSYEFLVPTNLERTKNTMDNKY